MPARTSRHQMTVYPRSRGEHYAEMETRTGYTGLSPLARGTRKVAWGRLTVLRFIPARAGNTIFDFPSTLHKSVYPRSRGEHAVETSITTTKRGLSPLARGTHCLCHRYRHADRFIPARAGNTGTFSGRSRPPAVYPRSRGEHIRLLLRGVASNGLSPLARGTPQSGRLPVVAGRFIPARAGNTR